ncbi:MAG: PaaI family thioesterase [Acidimicrobiales bacterium]
MTELIEPANDPSPPVRRRVVEWADPTIAATSAAGLTGVDFLRSIANGLLPQAPVAALLGMRLAEVESGRVVFELEVGEHLYNPIGSVHGGIISTALDSAMGCVVHSKLGRGQGYTTLELKVNFDRALTVAVAVVRAEAEIVTSGRRVATAVGRLVGPDGTLYAHASTTCLVFEVGG